ncbi:hypothetical protein ACJX0J_019721, partial [Zea mays]
NKIKEVHENKKIASIIMLRFVKEKREHNHESDTSLDRVGFEARVRHNGEDTKRLNRGMAAAVAKKSDANNLWNSFEAEVQADYFTITIFGLFQGQFVDSFGTQEIHTAYILKRQSRSLCDDNLDAVVAIFSS